MDPTSAAIASVGFTASVITVVGVAAEGSRVLHNLWRELKDAPADSKRLLSAVDTIEDLVKLIATKEETFRLVLFSPELRRMWNREAEQLEDVFASLKAEAVKLANRLHNPSSSKRHIRLRILKFFTQDGIEKYQRILTERVHCFNLLLSLSNALQNPPIPGQLDNNTETLNTILATLKEIKTVKVPEDQNLSIALSTSSTNSQLNVLYPRHPMNVRKPQVLPFVEDAPRYSRADPALRGPEKPRSSFNELCPVPKLVGSKWAVYQSSIGLLTLGLRKRETPKGDEHASPANLAYHEFELSYIPPSWLSSNVVRVSRQAHYTQYGGPGFKWVLNQVSYNSNPALVEAINTGDIATLKNLFVHKRARPTDVIAPWGRSLLHEAVFALRKETAAGTDMLNFLLDVGADVNAQSLDGRTPLLLCCRLMQNKALEPLMQQPVRRLLAGSADMAYIDSFGESACSYIFKASHGIGFLQTVVSKHMDLLTFQELATLDSWIFAAIARSVPDFEMRLCKEWESFHTSPAISSQSRQKVSSPLELSLERQLSEIQENKAFRIQFMRGICRKGDASMLEPLLRIGLDVNEATDWNDKASYLGEAAHEGNHETMSLLLKSGAKVWGDWSALDTLIERWKGMEHHMVEKEHPLFDDLLRRADISCPNALMRAVAYKLDYCTRRLLAAGFARKQHDFRQGSLYNYTGSEAMEAVKHDNLDGLRMLIEFGAGLDFEDLAGYTPLCQALDKGKIRLVECLVQGGAKCLHRTSAKLTAWDLAKQNLLAAHPRKPTLLGGFSSVINPPAVNYETDVEMHRILELVMKREDEVPYRPIRSAMQFLTRGFF